MPRIYIEDLSKHVGQEVQLQGWLYHKRSSGKIRFLLLRDGTGIIQCVMAKGNVSDEVFSRFDALSQESSFSVRGTVRKDDRALYGPDRNPTKFPFAGNLLTRTGWLDVFSVGAYPSYSAQGERRFWVNSGPFSMALGDTQDVVIAVVAGIGEDSPHSVQAVKVQAIIAADLYSNLKDYVDLEASGQPPGTNTQNSPTNYRLYQNHPNPFNPSTRVMYDLPIGADVRIVVYDLLGREVAVVQDEMKSAGSYSVVWDGRNKSSQPVPSSVYV